MTGRARSSLPGLSARATSSRARCTTLLTSISPARRFVALASKSSPAQRLRFPLAPHDITISAAQRQGENVVPATVVRQVFLGGNRDYMVEAKDGTQLRILTAAGENIPQGSTVWVHLPPERCRALSG